VGKQQEFKNTGISRIPKEWKVVELGNYIDVFSGYAFKREDFLANKSKGIPIIKIGNLQNGKVIIDDKTSFVRRDLYEKLADFRLHCGDVLIALSGATTGKIAVVDKDIGLALVNQRVGKFKILSSHISQKFFYFLAQSDSFKKFVLRNIGQSAQGNLSPNQVKKSKIPIPPLPEQKKIAEILSTVDKAIEKVDQAIEKTERLKKGLMQELLTKGINLFVVERGKILNAVKKCWENKHHEYGREENLTCHLVTYLSQEFPRYDVDVEVEKEGRLRPDIIIHKRNTRFNLFAIEVKKEANLRAVYEDVKKLEKLMLSPPYDYSEAIFIGFNVENFQEIFQLSDTVNFVLVDRTGKIKIKIRKNKFKNTEIGKISEKWGLTKLGDNNLTQIIMGQSPPSSTYNTESQGVPFLQGKAEFGEIYPLPVMHCSRPIKIAKPNDILLSVRAPVGEVNVAPFECCIGRGLAAIRVNEERLHYRMLFYYLKFKRRKFESLSSGSTFKAIKRNDIKGFPVPLPSLPEQKKIAEILSTVDKRLELLRKRKEKLERIKKGLMSELLTGKKRVKVGVDSIQ